MMRSRKLNRLSGHDYSKEGHYFVTVCVHNRVEWFGKVEDGEMILNEYGEIVKRQWMWLSQQYSYVLLDQFIVMPNHFHGILIIVGNGRDRSVHASSDGRSVHASSDGRSVHEIKSLSELMGAFKTTSSKLIHNAGLSKFHWQKSFHDHIIRNENDLNRIRQYIIDNPIKWGSDEENLKVRYDILIPNY